MHAIVDVRDLLEIVYAYAEIVPVIRTTADLAACRELQIDLRVRPFGTAFTRADLAITMALRNWWPVAEFIPGRELEFTEQPPLERVRRRRGEWAREHTHFKTARSVVRARHGTFNRWAAAISFNLPHVVKTYTEPRELNKSYAYWIALADGAGWEIELLLAQSASPYDVKTRFEKCWNARLLKRYALMVGPWTVRDKLHAALRHGHRAAANALVRTPDLTGFIDWRETLQLAMISGDVGVAHYAYAKL